MVSWDLSAATTVPVRPPQAERTRGRNKCMVGFLLINSVVGQIILREGGKLELEVRGQFYVFFI